MKPRSGRWHIIYSIIVSALQAAAIAVLIIVVLPLFGINIPVWGIVSILTAYAVFAYIMYRISHPTVLFKPVTEPETIVGKEGVVEVELNPAGYVRVEGELWKATCPVGGLHKGDIVVVTGMEGLKLTVGKKTPVL
ncbi:MAG: NfeD family protein [Chloroflexi bacterium]|nr:NfeD family protein [Chloroflexota bacterium]